MIFQPMAALMLAQVLQSRINLIIGIPICSLLVYGIFNMLTIAGVPSGTWQEAVLGFIVILFGVIAQRKKRDRGGKMTTPILEIKNLSKSFGTTKANQNISLSLEKGEVRGLAGENGSGKSTLLSQIAGICQKDTGEMLLNGDNYNPRTPMEAAERKIGIVVQELGVLSTLPAGINVFAGRLNQFSKFGMIQMGKVYEAAQQQFEQWGLTPVPLKKQCGTMPIETRKMIELARALSLEPEILILDEVTQSLSQNNREMLYRLIKVLKKKGKTIIMITHDLDEMIELCDQITVLRDGEVVGTKACAGLNSDELKKMMVGREINCAYYREDTCPDYGEEVILKADELTVPHGIQNVSFELHHGEILGFCGLSDSGIHMVGKTVYGLVRENTGTVTLCRKNIRIKNEQTALNHKMAYVPKDRDGEALMMRDSIVNNFVFPSLSEMKGFAGFINPKKLNQATRRNPEISGKMQWSSSANDGIIRRKQAKSQPGKMA